MTGTPISVKSAASWSFGRKSCGGLCVERRLARRGNGELRVAVEA